MRSIHLPKNTTEYPTIPKNIPEYPRIPKNTPILPRNTLRGPVNIPERSRNRYKISLFPETTKNYQNLIKMITMKINGTISRHNSSYMFKIEQCEQKQIIIAWLDIGKLDI